MNAVTRPASPAEEIRFGFAGSSLGSVLVVASGSGVAGILMGETRDAPP